MKNTKQNEKKLNFKNIKLDKEEQDLLASFRRGEWKTVDNLDEELAWAKIAASNSLQKKGR